MYNQKCSPSVEAKVDNMDEKLDREIHANEIATEALEAKSAHKRLDHTKDNQEWFWRTFARAFVSRVAYFIP